MTDEIQVGRSPGCLPVGGDLFWELIGRKEGQQLLRMFKMLLLDGVGGG